MLCEVATMSGCCDEASSSDICDYILNYIYYLTTNFLDITPELLLKKYHQLSIIFYTYLTPIVLHFLIHTFNRYNVITFYIFKRIMDNTREILTNSNARLNHS